MPLPIPPCSEPVRSTTADRTPPSTSMALRSPAATSSALYVLADDGKPFTAAQAREFAAMILAAADELDGLR
jgi:hypothetical protein